MAGEDHSGLSLDVRPIASDRFAAALQGWRFKTTSGSVVVTNCDDSSALPK